MVRVVFDPHQSPIRIKAIVFLTQNTAPSALADQKIVGTIPIPIGCLQIMWLLTNPFLAIGMGESK